MRKKFLILTELFLKAEAGIKLRLELYPLGYYLLELKSILIRLQ